MIKKFQFSKFYLQCHKIQAFRMQNPVSLVIIVSLSHVVSESFPHRFIASQSERLLRISVESTVGDKKIDAKLTRRSIQNDAKDVSGLARIASLSETNGM